MVAFMEMERMMEAEKTPTPGIPLSAESVKLLKAGDVLRCVKGSDEAPAIATGEIVTFIRPSGSGGVSNCIVTSADETFGYRPGRFTFIGRPDAEGWMTWSGGENPVPGQMVNLRWLGLAGDDHASWLSDQQDWPHVGSGHDIIAFRLTTPSDQGEEDPFNGLEEQIAAIKASPEYATESIAAEAYQVIGTIASAGGLFDHPDVQRALDYFGGDRDGEILPFAMSTTPASGSGGLEDAGHIRRSRAGGQGWTFMDAPEDVQFYASEDRSERYEVHALVTREAAEKRIEELEEEVLRLRDVLLGIAETDHYRRYPKQYEDGGVRGQSGLRAVRALTGQHGSYINDDDVRRLDSAARHAPALKEGR